MSQRAEQKPDSVVNARLSIKMDRIDMLPDTKEVLTYYET